MRLRRRGAEDKNAPNLNDHHQGQNQIRTTRVTQERARDT